MRRTEQVELTVACLLRRKEEILLQNRVKGDWQGYALPGGHVEPGESIVDAVIREIREETGLTILNPQLAAVKQFPIPGGRYLVFLFLAEEFEGTLSSSEEGLMEWVPRDKLPEYNCVDDLREHLDVIEDPRLAEFQYVIEDGEWKVVFH